MLRKHAVMAEGRQRRSARISALDTWKGKEPTRGGEKGAGVVQDSGNGQGQGVPGRKRGRKKRKLRAVEEVVVNSVEKTVDEAEQNLGHVDYPSNTNASPDGPPAAYIPEKRVLEKILDALQKKDTHEIFAEPVDAEEVEGYYDIIKDPMDFGTMRAKLQEGMYMSLEQFEHDVNLISSNAMHFNSSSTIFFRHAHSIQELSKRIFHALKTDPENFKLEQLTARRKPGNFMKKSSKNHGNGQSQGEDGGSDFSSLAKPATGVKLGNTTIDFASDGLPCSLYSQPSLRKNLHSVPMASGSSPLVACQREYEDLSGSRDGRKANFPKERRSSYRPWASFLNADESIFSILRNDPRQLVYVNRDDFSYTESLQRFVEDLGPTAQMVAKRKLQMCQIPALNCPTPVPSSHQAPTTPNGLINFPVSQVLLDNFSGHPTAHTSTRDERTNLRNTIIGEPVCRNQSSEIQMGSYFPSAQVQNSELLAPRVASAGVLSNRNSQGELASEFSQSMLLEFVLRNSSSSGSLPWPFQAMASSSGQASGSSHISNLHSLGGGENQVVGTLDPNLRVSLGHTGPSAQWSQPESLGQQAVLDMSYLQSRLGGMNSWSRNGFVRPELQQPDSVPETAFFGDATGFCERGSSHSRRAEPSSRALLDTQHPDLALQL